MTKEFEKIKKKAKRKSKKNSLPTSFYKAEDSLIEMIYDPETETTSLAVYKDGKIEYQQSVIARGKKLVPYSANNNLVKHKVVLFPSKAEDYDSEVGLIKEIQDFIYKYVDLSDFFQNLVPYYILFSWVYDCFNELPYLRFIGDTGSGKTRAVKTIGSICYKPIFATGGASVSPIFRTLDLFRGTLLIDEADYRFSDEKADIIKVLNCGNSPDFPVLRAKSKKQKEFDPVAFQVFGPKIFDTRGYFRDTALENRCITEEMKEGNLRDDIPINLPNEFCEEALELRNKLLMFRFKNYGEKKVKPELIDKSIEPRLNQIIIPLASIIPNEKTRKELRTFVQEYNEQLIADRGMGEAGQVVEIIRDINKPKVENLKEEIIPIKTIASRYIEEFGEKTGSGKQVSPKWVGWLVRKNLKLKAVRTREGYVIPKTEQEKLENLYKKFGLIEKKK